MPDSQDREFTKLKEFIKEENKRLSEYFISSLKEEVAFLKKDIDELKVEKEKQTIRVKRLETENSTLLEDIIQELNQRLDISLVNSDISGFNVFGKNPTNKSVLVEFATYSAKISVLKKCKLLKGTTVFIAEDLSPSQQAVRKELLKYQSELRSSGKTVKLRGNRLIVDGQSITLEKLSITTTNKTAEVPSVAEILKDHELPLKKQKLSEYHNTLTQQMPYNMQHIQQIYASLDPVYIQCLQEFSTVNRHLSAFKPVVQNIKGSKIRHANAMGRYTTDPPVLQNPERVVLMSESERFERSYQPNVALAPPAPKKHRYGKGGIELASTNANTNNVVVKTEVSSSVRQEPDTQCTGFTKENHVTNEKPVESAVSVVQRLKYNPEIELSTDTEDSASETSEKHELSKIEDILKGVDSSVKDKVVEFMKTLSKENERLVQDARTKEERIRDLELRNMKLLKELNTLKLNSKENHILENGDLSPKSNDSINGSSIITSSDSICSETKNTNNSYHIQKSVIASVGEQKEVIVKTAPE
ncbi:uncharacterized protein LOC114336288 [Diabrotica virgifera virgifera]|uniref:Uncharacterized protein n=1 Tax=Diabrotica virgifera virgifera TaxID=50390 RepID=A0ABM5KXR3_DIAVI|nr:uncharacterized protein LOC114336288 [Diabrotica virgifera virgifera]